MTAPPWVGRDISGRSPSADLEKLLFGYGEVEPLAEADDAEETPAPPIVEAFAARDQGDVPAAEDTRIFQILRWRAEAVERAGLDVESRPDRKYLIERPGSAQADEIRPDYHGVRMLKASTHVHGRIATHGLGLMFPPHTVHAENSTAVVMGNHCRLTQVDHVHIRKAEVAQDDALASPRVAEILAKASAGNDNTDVVQELMSTLAELTDQPTETGPTSVDRRVRADCVTSIHQAETVDLGDNNLIQLDSRFVVERTVIPAGALLAADEDLAGRYVELVAGPQDDASELAGFLADLVGAADNAETDNLLGYADGLPEQKATFLGLFGLTEVRNTTSLMIGVDNELTTELKLAVVPMRADGDIADAVQRHRASRDDYEDKDSLK